MTDSRVSTLRWSACFALALCFHAAGAAALLARWNESSDLVANAPLIMVDLAPVAVSPETTPNELPPGPQQMQAQPEPRPDKPVEKIELPAQPNAEPLLAITPPKQVEKPKEKQPKQKHASLASAPSNAEQKSDRAAAPAPGASSRDPNALPNWKSQLVAQIERHKRYPEDARGDHGVVQVAFGVDRSGGVHHARVAASSGSSVLDRDAIAWLERSQPLPPPPPEMGGAMISITVPLRYNYR
jgi:periplasmic protein TonB